jgi:hypothetical protein
MEKTPKPIQKDRQSKAYQDHEEYDGLDSMPIIVKSVFEEPSTASVAVKPNEVIQFPKAIVSEN